ncbi:MAG: hypothetical protein PHU75_02300 [Candidatus Nanopelagicales bacterium]|nr:hypothetical protein [Candidatus Nanopelagicales bacterium]
MTLPPGAWILDGDPSVLTLAAQAKGRTVRLTAPIHAADLTVDAAGVVLTMSIGINDVRSGGFIMDTALRAFLVGYGANELFFVGSGAADADPPAVTGVARSGRVAVDLDLVLTPVEHTAGTLGIALSGTAVFEDVDVPIPGIGRLDSIVLAAAADLRLRADA